MDVKIAFFNCFLSEETCISKELFMIQNKLLLPGVFDLALPFKVSEQTKIS